MGLERDPLSLTSRIQELIERKNSGSGLENQDYGHMCVFVCTYTYTRARFCTDNAASDNFDEGVTRTLTYNF
jgi:hypothetical protein